MTEVNIHLKDVHGEPLASTDVTFSPYVTAYKDGASISIAQQFSIRTDIEGYAKTKLAPGKYIVCLISNIGEKITSFDIVVPDCKAVYLSELLP